LQQNRADLAAKEAQRARKWAQDSLLVNIAESWVGMREVRPSQHLSIRTCTNHMHREERSTNPHSTSLRSSPKPRNHSHHTRSSHKPSRNYILVVFPRLKPPYSRLLRSIPSQQTRLRIWLS
jgi:hypothetical protein